MLSEVTTCSQPGKDGTLGVPPVAMSTWRAVKFFSPAAVRTRTLCPSTSVAQPRTISTPGACSNCWYTAFRRAISLARLAFRRGQSSRGGSTSQPKPAASWKSCAKCAA